MRSTWLSLVFLLLLSLSVDSFSRGAPESACEEDMRPRHGFATQDINRLVEVDDLPIILREKAI